MFSAGPAASVRLPRSLSSRLRRSAARLLDALLPPACALCAGAVRTTAARSATGATAQAGTLLCYACRAQFFSAAALGPRCCCCANPLPQLSVAPLPLCGPCQRQHPAYARTVVACAYEPPLAQLVLQLKFGQQLAYAGLMAQQLRDALLRQPEVGLPELLCPVPLGPRRLAERGYNQALEIARPLARQLGIALAPRLLLRVRETAPQSLVTAAARQSNLRDAFALSNGELVQGRHIGVVDDVMTSGSTLQEIAATLQRYGARRVSNLVFARTPPH